MRYAILIAIFFAACSSEPDRPSRIPTDAIWAGGSDGGAWVQCGQTTKEPYAAFDCVTFHENGSVWGRGHFIHATNSAAGFVPIGAPFPRINFQAYDGSIIYLTNETALVPDGWIEYPLEPAHGKKQQFHLGREVSSEVSY
jgi:hypothetical protein